MMIWNIDINIPSWRRGVKRGNNGHIELSQVSQADVENYSLFSVLYKAQLAKILDIFQLNSHNRFRRFNTVNWVSFW